MVISSAAIWMGSTTVRVLSEGGRRRKVSQEAVMFLNQVHAHVMCMWISRKLCRCAIDILLEQHQTREERKQRSCSAMQFD
jgi:hypothetical protein